MTIEMERAEHQVIEDFRVRREIIHPSGPAWEAAVQMERERRAQEGPPDEKTGGEEEAIERWLDPEPVPRSLIRQALWEMERHWWTPESKHLVCVCGGLVTDSPIDKYPQRYRHQAMRDHKEDVLAQMLGLTIRPEAP